MNQHYATGIGKVERRNGKSNIREWEAYPAAHPVLPTSNKCDAMIHLLNRQDKSPRPTLLHCPTRTIRPSTQAATESPVRPCTRTVEPQVSPGANVHSGLSAKRPSRFRQHTTSPGPAVSARPASAFEGVFGKGSEDQNPGTRLTTHQVLNKTRLNHKKMIADCFQQNWPMTQKIHLQNRLPLAKLWACLRDGSRSSRDTRLGPLDVPSWHTQRRKELRG